MNERQEPLTVSAAEFKALIAAGMAGDSQLRVRLHEKECHEADRMRAALRAGQSVGKTEMSLEFLKQRAGAECKDDTIDDRERPKYGMFRNRQPGPGGTLNRRGFKKRA